MAPRQHQGTVHPLPLAPDAVPAGVRLRLAVGWSLLALGSAVILSNGVAAHPAAGGLAEMRGAFITVASPITSASFHEVKRQCDAALKNGAAILVFDIQPGSSDYGNCLNLAHYMEEISLGQRGKGQGVKTVAYLSRSLDGHGVLVALAADELVMSRKAELGPAVSHDERFVSRGMLAEYGELARRRKPGYEAIVLGMLVKDYRVWKVITAKGTRYVLDDELKKAEAEEAVRSKEVLVEKGQLASFNGDQLRDIGLVRLMAESRAELAEAYGLPPKTARESVRGEGQLRPVHIRITGLIDLLMEEYVRRHVRAAREEGKNFFIIEIDSDGGYARVGMDLAEFIRDELKDATTVAYIPDHAISAAAFVALGCDRIVMQRNAKLGDCGVLFAQEGSQFQYVPEKELSYYRTALETLAQDKGYPPALVLGMIDKDLVVKEVRDPDTGGTLFLSQETIAEKGHEKLEVVRTVKAAGRFLTMDGETALALGFASDLVDNFDGVRAVYGLENAPITMIDQNWVDTLIWVLNSRPVAAFLIVIGLIGLYLEVKMPGVALPGIVAALCFLLFFWSRFMGGTATALEILLFLAGILCIGVEIFVIPGFGVFGLTGILLLFFSIVLASQTFILPRSPDDWDQLSWNLGSLLFALACVMGFGILVSKYLPEMPILGRMILKPDLIGLPASEVIAGRTGPYDDLSGAEGLAATSLRPAGRVQFGDRFVDVVTDGSYIPAGARVRVVEVWGHRVVVKEA